jgi:2',3'-cyclic-nucleotide 2'-phosphodiesterase (5'-nucleotidase family)
MTVVQRPRDPHAVQSAASRRMGIPVVQDGEFGHDLGQLDLHFEQNGSGAWELRAAEWKTLPITAALPERLDVAALIERQAAPLRRPIGRVEVPGRSAAERDLSTRRLIARALKAETGADVGLEPAESLFGEWKTGPISRYDVCYALPFPNHAAVVTVKGADLVKALAQPGMAVAGADVGTRSSGPEADIRIGGAALDSQRSYRVVAEDYHAANTPGLKGAPAESREDVRDLVARWLEKGGGG